MNAPIPCSESSLAGGEPLPGTANEAVTRWLMVEEPGPWGAKVPKQAEGLRDEARAHLLRINDRDDARVQLIRRPGAHPERRQVFAARVDADGGRLFGARFDPAALAELDLDALVEGRGGAAPVDEPVFFVCSHGTRDACCARYGVSLYSRFAERVPGRTWQCSHLGGHRFAPTMLVLPHGAVYGRLSPEHVDAIVAAADRAELFSVEYLRGRTAFERPVQAAEAFLRERTGVLGLDAVQLVRADAVSDSRWEITFTLDGKQERLVVEAETSSEAIYGSCDDESAKPFLRYALIEPRDASLVR